MKYFITESKRRGTCYFEFQKGKYRGEHWLEDGLYLSADVFDELGLFDLFSKTLKEFNYYGISTINSEEWNTLLHLSSTKDRWKAAIDELTPWVNECFQENDIFTICGI